MSLPEADEPEHRLWYIAQLAEISAVLPPVISTTEEQYIITQAKYILSIYSAYPYYLQ